MANDDYDVREVTHSGSVKLGKRETARFWRFVEAFYGRGRWIAQRVPGLRTAARRLDIIKPWEVPTPRR